MTEEHIFALANKVIDIVFIFGLCILFKDKIKPFDITDLANLNKDRLIEAA